MDHLSSMKQRLIFVSSGVFESGIGNKSANALLAQRFMGQLLRCLVYVECDDLFSQYLGASFPSDKRPADQCSLMSG